MDIVETTLRDRSARLSEAITKNNALLNRMLEAQKNRPPPTLRQRLRRKWWNLREAVGSKIAGCDLCECDD